METILFALFLTIFIATVLNILLKQFNISHIIGYIVTGTAISYIFSFNGQDIHTLDIIGEFGIAFLMFTIGLELNFEKIKKMKDILLINGFFQVALTTIVTFVFAYFVFGLDLNTSIIVALAFSLSSTAIVLTYLKESKDIYTPYGQKSMGILVFQDLAIIPILLLIGFLSNNDMSISEIIVQTVFSAIIVVAFLFTIGKYIVKKLLEFSGRANLEELFLGSVFAIVLGASLLAHDMGFTYSLGAFLAGMIIADTGFSVKVESDIASYKDLLLGTFFFTVGTKIDVVYFLSNIHIILGIFLLIFLFKSIVIYFLIRRKEDKNTSAKTALALAQVGEFSFAIFALAANDNLISQEMSSFLVFITVISMILTPFIINNIYKISGLFEKEFYESDVITPIKAKDHVVIAGFSLLGRIIAHRLAKENIEFVIITDNLKHVLLARKLGYMGYFGHLDKKPVLESLKVEEASSVIVTINNMKTKRLICEAVLNFQPKANIIVKVDSLEQRKSLRDIKVGKFIDSNLEVGNIIADEAISFKNSYCNLE